MGLGTAVGGFTKFCCSRAATEKKMMDLAFCITVGDHLILALPFSFGGLQFA